MYKIGKSCTENTHSDTLASPIIPQYNTINTINKTKSQYNKINWNKTVNKKQKCKFLITKTFSLYNIILHCNCYCCIC